MFLNALAGAIDAAHPKQFDYLSRQLWQAHAAGHIADQDAQALAERLHKRRGASEAGVVRYFRSGVPPPYSGEAIPHPAVPGTAIAGPAGFPQTATQACGDRTATASDRGGFHHGRDRRAARDR
jgi:hypothetical protein